MKQRGTKKRYLVDDILHDLAEKMVFIGGARQVGKTIIWKNSFFRLCNAIAKHYGSTGNRHGSTEPVLSLSKGDTPNNL